MKKLFILLPIAALMFASCSNDEQVSAPSVQNVPEGAIWFSSGLKDMTRGATTMENFRAFNVSAVHDDAQYAFNDLAVTSSDGMLWTYNTGDNENPYKYWPADNSQLKFFAYAPATLQNKMAIVTSSQQMNAFQQVQHVADHVDVLAAFAKGSKAANASSGVTLDFKHALAQIEVRCKNSKPSDFKVEVLGVKLCRIGDTGDMTFQTAADGYPAWSAISGSQSFIKKGTGAVNAIEMTAQPQNIMFGADNFLMLPQQLTAWAGSGTDTQGAYLSVLCRIYHKENDEWVQKYPNTADKFGFTAVPISTNWTPGHRYVYTLDFYGTGGGAGQVDPDPENPEDRPTHPGDPGYDPENPGGDSDVDPTPDDGEPGDPVAPDPNASKAGITFTVSITDWINGQSDNETLDF